MWFVAVPIVFLWLGKMHGVYDEVEHSPDFGSKPKLMVEGG